MSQSELPNLHDATLESVVLHWREGIAKLEFDMWPQTTVLVEAHGLLDFRLARRQEWGPSDSVNAANTSKTDAGEIALTVEMQSGDEIQVICEALDVTLQRSSAE